MARCNTALSAVQHRRRACRPDCPGRAAAHPAPPRFPPIISPSGPTLTGTVSPSFDGAGEDRLGQRILHRFLDDALERTRPIGRVIALLAEPVARLLGQFEPDLALVEELFAGA